VRTMSAMAAPDFVPVRPGTRKSYESPPRRPDSWTATRPAEVIEGGQPEGPALGSQGPDQGYALKLANSFRGKLHLAAGEHDDDAIAGCLGVALRRAAIYGRAPMMPDLKLAFALFGFTSEAPDPELVAFRTPLFAEVANPHHYREARHLANLVPEASLRLSPDAVAAAKDWRALLGQ
jgi:hypothetical protein